MPGCCQGKLPGFGAVSITAAARRYRGWAIPEPRGQSSISCLFPTHISPGGCHTPTPLSSWVLWHSSSSLAPLPAPPATCFFPASRAPCRATSSGTMTWQATWLQVGARKPPRQPQRGRCQSRTWGPLACILHVYDRAGLVGLWPSAQVKWPQAQLATQQLLATATLQRRSVEPSMLSSATAGDNTHLHKGN